MPRVCLTAKPRQLLLRSRVSCFSFANFRSPLGMALFAVVPPLSRYICLLVGSPLGSLRHTRFFLTTRATATTHLKNLCRFSFANFRSLLGMARFAVVPPHSKYKDLLVVSPLGSLRHDPCSYRLQCITSAMELRLLLRYNMQLHLALSHKYMHTDRKLWQRKKPKEPLLPCLR